MFIEKILEIIDVAGYIATETIFVDYSKSRKNLNRMAKNPEQVLNYIEERRFARQEKQRFYNLISYLQNKGLIEKDENSLMKLTKKGRERLAEKLKPVDYRPIPSFYNKDKDSLKVLIFDIPESKRKSRNWIRQSLHNLGFNMLQKSVWIGNTKLPKDFLNRLKEFGLVNYVHIFEVKEKGSIEF